MTNPPPAVCPRCHAPLAPAVDFCSSCGLTLTPPSTGLKIFRGITVAFLILGLIVVVLTVVVCVYMYLQFQEV